MQGGERGTVNSEGKRERVGEDKRRTKQAKKYIVVKANGQIVRDTARGERQGEARNEAGRREHKQQKKWIKQRTTTTKKKKRNEREKGRAREQQQQQQQRQRAEKGSAPNSEQPHKTKKKKA